MDDRLQMATKLQIGPREQDRECRGPKPLRRVLTLQQVVLVWQESPARGLVPSQAMAGLMRLVEVPKLVLEPDWGWVLTRRAEVGALG